MRFSGVLEPCSPWRLNTHVHVGIMLQDDQNTARAQSIGEAWGVFTSQSVVLEKTTLPKTGKEGRATGWTFKYFLRSLRSLFRNAKSCDFYIPHHFEAKRYEARSWAELSRDARNLGTYTVRHRRPAAHSELIHGDEV